VRKHGMFLVLKNEREMPMTSATAYILIALVTSPSGSVEAQQVDFGLTAEDCAYVLTSSENRGDFACIPDLGFDMVVSVKTETRG